jgi:hypothetical protein
MSLLVSHLSDVASMDPSNRTPIPVAYIGLGLALAVDILEVISIMISKSRPLRLPRRMVMCTEIAIVILLVVSWPASIHWGVDTGDDTSATPPRGSSQSSPSILSKNTPDKFVVLLMTIPIL